MVDCKDVSFAYKGQSSIEFPSFNLKEQEQALLIGGSGSGKTTLLHIIGGILEGASGMVRVNETNISQLKGADLDKFRGRNIGMIFQKPYLIGALTALENILIAQTLSGGNKDKDKAKKILDELDLHSIMNKYPSKLSYGQQQRVAVARALVNEPQLIIADEPTASLDDQNAENVLQLLKEQATKYKANLLIATHDGRVKSNIPLHISL